MGRRGIDLQPIEAGFCLGGFVISFFFFHKVLALFLVFAQQEDSATLRSVSENSGVVRCRLEQLIFIYLFIHCRRELKQ